MTKKVKPKDNTIALNRQARHEYHLEDKFEAGLVLEGWEVKSLRQGRVNITDGFIQVCNGEVHIHNVNISPLLQASTHNAHEPTRPRKLLLNKREIDTLVGAVERKGYSLIPVSLYWVKNYVKLAFHLAKGKKAHDKRNDAKDRDWSREQARLLKKAV